MKKEMITAEAMDEYLRRLAATPGWLAAGAASVGAARLRAAPAPKAWSAVEHLAHLRGCDDVWSQTVYAMLLHEAPTLPLFNPRDWAKTARYAALDWEQSLQAFTLKRAEYLAVLRALKPASWKRSATIGNHTHSVFSQVRRTVLHEEEHCAQVEALLKAER
jgi:hypothetical protein